jgi:cob(I)alamin adenosyltransferase
VQRFLFRVGGQLASKDVQYIEPVSEEDVEKAYERRPSLRGDRWPQRIRDSREHGRLCEAGHMQNDSQESRERRIIALSRLEKVPDPVRKYINRLSDFLYILARYEEFKEKKLLYKNDID